MTAVPDLSGRSADVTKLVSAVNMLNPNQLFGADPFGVDLGMDYAVRLTGQLQITTPGVYTFKLGADEAARMTIAGTIAAEIRSGTGSLQEDTGTMGLTAGSVPSRSFLFTISAARKSNCHSLRQTTRNRLYRNLCGRR